MTAGSPEPTDGAPPSLLGWADPMPGGAPCSDGSHEDQARSAGRVLTKVAGDSTIERMAAPIDLSSLTRALAVLEEACAFWSAEPVSSPLKRHLRSAVVQSFEFTYELAVRSLRRVLIERAASADLVADLSFNDLLRSGADSALVEDPLRWRRWREMRNITSHAYNEAQAETVASAASEFRVDAAALLRRLEASLAG